VIHVWTDVRQSGVEANDGLLLAVAVLLLGPFPCHEDVRPSLAGPPVAQIPASASAVTYAVGCSDHSRVRRRPAAEVRAIAPMTAVGHIHDAVQEEQCAALILRLAVELP